MTNWLYVVTPEGAERPCKVGYSCNPEKRAKEMNVGSPVKLIVRHVAAVDGPAPEWGSSRPYWRCNRFARKVETFAHKSLGRVGGRSEWFDVPLADAVEVINRAVKENRFAA